MLEKWLFPPASFNEQKLRNAIEGKTILITGASSGIGEQVAYLLAHFDVHLILVARREEKLLQMKEEIEKKRAKVTVCRADLRQEEEMKVLLTLLHERCERLHIVVQNAGHSIHRSIFQSLDRYHDFTRTMAINYFAPVQLLLSVIPLLVKSNGQIINVSTINALIIPFPEWSAYQASKIAFDTWLRSNSPELMAKNIDITTIYLPLVKTPMIEPTKAYQHMPAMSPTHVANIICKSMYTKRKIYKPWWVPFLELCSVVCRRLIERMMVSMYKKRRKSEGR